MEPKDTQDNTIKMIQMYLKHFFEAEEVQKSLNESLLLVLIGFFAFNGTGYALTQLIPTSVVGLVISIFTYLAVLIALSVMYIKARK